MKQENLIYTILTILVIAGAIMKMMHLNYGNLIFSIALYAGIIFQGWLIKTLKKRVKELEK
ncbi:hypothetical protein [Ekhidna sp.]|uniref:hypothetical protein n=1 Tax=Ekhidna sp. TaxID=2608089 RepID=UPI003CCB943A